jgi:hypothetical protein
MLRTPLQATRSQLFCVNWRQPYFHGKRCTMEMLISLVSGVFGIVSLVCWILVLIKMFQNDAVAPAVASIVLILCGIGPLVAFVYGWMKATPWGLQRLMLIWTLALLAQLVLVGVSFIPHQIGI